MRWKTCWYLVRSDVYRAAGHADLRSVGKVLLTSPANRVIAAYRVGAWARSADGRRLARAVSKVLYGHWSAVYGIEIPFATHVGPGFRINHRGGGVIVNERARIGAGVTLAPGVVVGNNTPDPRGPVLEDAVTAYVGAKIIGAITVGAGSRIGANAVAIRDVPAGSVVVGVPARVLSGKTSMEADRLDWERVLGPPPDDAS